MTDWLQHRLTETDDKKFRVLVFESFDLITEWLAGIGDNRSSPNCVEVFGVVLHLRYLASDIEGLLNNYARKGGRLR
jgi:hypothetical protein